MQLVAINLEEEQKTSKLMNYNEKGPIKQRCAVYKLVSQCQRL